MSGLRAIAAVITLLLLAGCGSATTSSTGSHSTPAPSAPATTTAVKLGRYPAANEQAFLKSCMREATLHTSQARATSYCRVALACIEQRLSLGQFIEWNRDTLLGRANPYAKVGLGCIRTAAARTLRSS